MGIFDRYRENGRKTRVSVSGGRVDRDLNWSCLNRLCPHHGFAAKLLGTRSYNQTCFTGIDDLKFSLINNNCGAAGQEKFCLMELEIRYVDRTKIARRNTKKPSRLLCHYRGCPTRKSRGQKFPSSVRGFIRTVAANKALRNAAGGPTNHLFQDPPIHVPFFASGRDKHVVPVTA